MNYMNTSVIDFATAGGEEKGTGCSITRGYLLSSSGTVQYLYNSMGVW